MRLFRALLQFAFLVCFIAVLSGSAWGQTTASLRGTVTDQTGGVVVGAKVILINTGTGIARTAATANDGLYLFDLVQVGRYSLTVDKPGFESFIQDGIVLELNQNGRLDVALKIGKETQTVEVSSNVVQVDTTGAVLGKVENERMINDLPLLDRDTLQLGLLQAGVFAPDPDDGSGNPFSVSGQRSESLTFLLDGGNNTDFLGNNIVVSPNPDAVEEFKILTNNYDAQYGRTSGGIVNQITKSGTNSFHGDLFEFNRNNVFNARDYFLPVDQDKQAFKRNQFGGTVGGPLKKDKLFFFLAYQATRSRVGQTSPQLTVLTPAQRTGDFSSLCSTYVAGACTDPNGTQLTNPITGNIYPNNQVPVNPVIANYIQDFLPLPNVGSNGFISSPTAAIDDDQGITHIDYNLSKSDLISFVYLVDDTRQAYPFQIINGASTGGDVPLGSGFQTNFRDQIGAFTWTHTFSPGMLNEFRFAANRTATLQASPTDKTTPAALGFTNVSPDDSKGAAPPIIYTNGFNLGPSPQGPTTLHDATFEWSDNYTWTRDRHEIKFGADISRIRQNFHYDFYNNGSYDFTFGDFTGDETADFVAGFWDNYFQFSKATYGIRTGATGLYVQDTWKVTKHLTLNYGLRWDYFWPQSDVHNNILGFFPGTQSTVFPDAPPDILYPGDPGTPNRALVYPDKNNFAPRLGFAWDMFGNSKLVMRGGFGIFYDIEDGALNLQFGGQPPFGYVSNNFPNSYAGVVGDTPGTGPVADPFTPLGLTNPFPFTFTGAFLVPKISFAYTTFPHFRTPYSENFNYGFQWQATPNTMVEAVYVGSLGRKLISSGETNFPVPSVMQQQLTNFGATNPECARPLAACVDFIGGPVLSGPESDPGAFPTGVQQLLTNFSNGLSDSHEFQLTVDKRFSHGFIFRAAYTLSKTIDLTSGFRARSSEYTDPLDYRLDRALADFDTPQRLVISGLWELPFDHGIENGILKKILGGWQFNAIASYQKGNPFSLFSNNNSSQQDQNPDLSRPNVLAPTQYENPRNGQQVFNTGTANCISPDAGDINGNVTGAYWFNPSSYDCVNVPLFSFGDAPRNFLRGPGIDNYDLSIVKKTSFMESKSVEFRAEFFNAFNHVQFFNPNTAGGSGTFGQITTDRNPRLIQFGLKFYF
ncbi:MAG TPA: carboxypeptidase regulatory-like domain-containing protein [Candidatus Acidoferrales bacterium]|nr:carboxypeptidase regulatory-like domain-containing protein [Candidatus Acidoferrales bacterium]